MSFFKGNIVYIYDANIVCNILNTNPMSRVLSLDEDNTIPMLDHERNGHVLLASILLPSIETMWAIADNDNEKFQYEYNKQLQSQECVEFIYTIIASIYTGTNIILYYPDPNEDAIKYLYNYFLNIYGLHIGYMNSDPFSYNINMIPLYLNIIYTLIGVMDPYSYLIQYPTNINIPDNLYDKLINELNIYGDNLYDKRILIDKLHNKLKIKPNAKYPIIRAY